MHHRKELQHGLIERARQARSKLRVALFPQGAREKCAHPRLA